MAFLEVMGIDVSKVAYKVVTIKLPPGCKMPAQEDARNGLGAVTWQLESFRGHGDEIDALAERYPLARKVPELVPLVPWDLSVGTLFDIVCHGIVLARERPVFREETGSE